MSELNHFNKIELLPAPIESKLAIKNLARFYVYELSRYKADEKDSGFPEDGLYEPFESCFEFEKYWGDPNYFPFIIRVNDELAGFALVNKKGSSKEIDWYLAEFFVVAKFQAMGIGRQIAFQLFNQFKGTWELTQLPANIRATRFWQSVLNEYTHGNFTETKQICPNPTPHEMILHRFQNYIT